MNRFFRHGAACAAVLAGLGLGAGCRHPGPSAGSATGIPAPQPVAVPAAPPTVPRGTEQAQIGRQLNDAFAQARAALNASDLDHARQRLTLVVENAAQASELTFDPHEAAFLLGEVCSEQRDLPAARAAYEAALAEDGAPPTPWHEQAQRRLDRLPPPPRAWPVHTHLDHAPAWLCVVPRSPAEAPLAAALATAIAADLEALDASVIRGTNVEDRVLETLWRQNGTAWVPILAEAKTRIGLLVSVAGDREVSMQAVVAEAGTGAFLAASTARVTAGGGNAVSPDALATRLWQDLAREWKETLPHASDPIP